MKKETTAQNAIEVKVGGLSRADWENNPNVFSPALDIYENKEGIVIELELPDIEKDQIKIVLEENRLMLKGLKKFDKNTEAMKFYLLERPYGRFGKLFDLPEDIDTDEISATLQDGILKINIPYLKEKSQGRKGK